LNLSTLNLEDSHPKSHQCKILEPNSVSRSLTHTRCYNATCLALTAISAQLLPLPSPHIMLLHCHELFAISQTLHNPSFIPLPPSPAVSALMMDDFSDCNYDASCSCDSTHANDENVSIDGQSSSLVTTMSHCFVLWLVCQRRHMTTTLVLLTGISTSHFFPVRSHITPICQLMQPKILPYILQYPPSQIPMQMMPKKTNVPFPQLNPIAHFPHLSNGTVFMSLDIETGGEYCEIVQLLVLPSQTGKREKNMDKSPHC